MLSYMALDCRICVYYNNRSWFNHICSLPFVYFPLGPSKRSSSCKAAVEAGATLVTQQQQQKQATPTDSNSNPISPVVSDDEEEEEEGLEHCQSESYHWCEEEDDLTSSEAVTTTASTDKTLATTSSGGDQQQQQLDYVEMAKKVDTNLAHIDMEDFKSADLFRSESLLIEYQERCSQSQVRSVPAKL